MSPILKASASAEIRSVLDQATADTNKVPGCVFVVVNKDGKTLFEHASGRRGSDSKAPMTLDSIFWIASCTKMICGIAAMQLVEQGKLNLNDTDKIEELCPELKKIRILKNVDEHGEPEFVEKKARITMRMLLTHTAGFGYAFFNENLRRWGQPFGCDEFSGHANDILGQPLLFEPGTRWEYGVGIDWAGTVIERISGMSLNDYFQKNIFQPLGIKNISFFPSAEMKKNLAHMHQKDANGKIMERDHLLRRPLIVDGDDIAKTYNSAGAGCFARPAEYCEILATLLNNGTSPTTQRRLLSTDSITEIFKNQIPQFPNFGRQGIPAAKPDLTNPIPDMYPQPPDQPQGWGLTFMLTLHEGATGRADNTAWWAGLPNLFWWCDREKGVAGLIATQILPFADPNVLELWAKVESMVYANLEDGDGGNDLGVQDLHIGKKESFRSSEDSDLRPSSGMPPLLQNAPPSQSPRPSEDDGRHDRAAEKATLQSSYNTAIALKPAGSHTNNKQSLDYALRTGLAGGLAGCAVFPILAKTLVGPLDRVKILFQASNPQFAKYTGSWSGIVMAMRDINQQDGVRGLFRGHSATLLRIFPYAATKFVAYEQFRSVLIPSKEYETPLRRLLSGSLAGVSSVFLTYPLEVIRVRLAFETKHESRSSLSSICRQIYQEHPTSVAKRSPSSTLTAPIANAIPQIPTPRSGLVNFYRGFSPTLAGMLPYAGMSFLTHDTAGDYLRHPILAPYTTRPNPNPKTPSALPILTYWAELLAGGFAGLVSQTASYPLE
ncbi:MAG: hypothetical protein Q9218_004442, partial [Villophora microphyllina]